jgi:hypothetical protein
VATVKAKAQPVLDAITSCAGESGLVQMRTHANVDAGLWRFGGVRGLERSSWLPPTSFDRA